MNKNEMIEGLKAGKTIRLLGINEKNLIDALLENSCVGDCENEIQKLNEKIARLSDANKQLRAENKELKARI